jgi:hypothetical protein
VVYSSWTLLRQAIDVGDGLRRAQQCLAEPFGIRHSTLQGEQRVPCHQAQHDVP